MGIRKRWSKFNKTNVSKVPEDEGAYQLGYSYGGKKTAYIGSSTNLRRRLTQHLSNPDKAKYPYFRYIVAEWNESGKELEAELAEEFASKKPAKPKGSKKLPKKRGLLW